MHFISISRIGGSFLGSYPSRILALSYFMTATDSKKKTPKQTTFRIIQPASILSFGKKNTSISHPLDWSTETKRPWFNGSRCGPPFYFILGKTRTNGRRWEAIKQQYEKAAPGGAAGRNLWDPSPCFSFLDRLAPAWCWSLSLRAGQWG